MKHKLFTLFFVLMTSMSLMALGRNDGSSKANAIEYDWENGVTHPGGTLWYRLALEPLYYADSVRLYITNPSNTEAVNVVCKTTILLPSVMVSLTDSIKQTLAPQTTYDGWRLHRDPFVSELVTEMFFTVSSTGTVKLSWQAFLPTGDSCEHAKWLIGHQETGTKWYTIPAPYLRENEVIERLEIHFANADENYNYNDIPNTISVGFKTDCNSPAFQSQTFTIEPSGDKTITFSAEFLTSLGWPNLVFSCTSSTDCYVDCGYYVHILGESCKYPLNLAWDTIEHPANMENWYLLELDSTMVPRGNDLCIIVSNTSNETANYNADFYFDCTEHLYTKNSELTPYGSDSIIFSRDFLFDIGWSDLLIDFTSNQTVSLRVEIIPHISSACTIASGTCGENLTWELSCDSVLTISGTGEIMDWNEDFAPWFSYRENIISVTLGNNVTSIGGHAFYGCTGLTSIEIPNSVTSIGEYAFSRCTGLTSIEIPNSVTSIGERAFYDCSGLMSVTIGNSVTSIGDWFFAGCSSLTSVSIGNSVTSIGEDAFRNCSSLTSIEIPNSVTSIGQSAFNECSGLTSVEIPNSVTSIGEGAFWECFNLKSVIIGNSVTSIGKRAFSHCSGLTSMVVEGGNTTYDSRGNCNAIIETETNTLLFGCKITIIPNSVTSIGGWAFSGSSGLMSIEIPESVTSIGEQAFRKCSGLTSIEIPHCVTSIGRYAFAECTGLTSITNYATTPQTIDNVVFKEVDKSIPLYVPAQSISAYQAADVWKEFFNILPIEGTVEPTDSIYNVVYIDQAGLQLETEPITLHLPEAPVIEGFTFLKWQVVAGDLENGIYIQAVYTANEPTSAPAVYTNPANPAQKLIRNGNVYILTDDKTYTVTGQEVK